jgi:hypothetical protein
VTTRLAAAVALGALAAGAGCVVLGRDVLAEPSRLDAARGALAAPQPAVVPLRAARVTATLVGSGGEREALTAADDVLGAHTLAAAARAESEVAALAGSGPADRRSWAASLVSALELEQVQRGDAEAKKHLAGAISALQAAVVADPANEGAKRNLELLLTLQQHDKKRSRGPAQHSGRSHRAVPRAGHSTPGYGW